MVTVFEPDIERNGVSFDYAEELLLNPDNFELKIEKRQSTRSAIGKKHPNTSSELPSFKKSLPQTKHSVNDSVENNLPKTDVKYSYAGEKAKAVNMTNLQAAVDMEESGNYNANEIRKATGWFRNYDEKWRFEIDDSKMQVIKTLHSRIAE